MAAHLHLLVLVKHASRYVFVYDDESATTIIRLLGQYAADPEMDFTWYDASYLSQLVRNRRGDSHSNDTGGHGWRQPPQPD